MLHLALKKLFNIPGPVESSTYVLTQEEDNALLFYLRRDVALLCQQGHSAFMCL